MNLKRRRACTVAVLLRSKPPVPIDVGEKGDGSGHPGETYPKLSTGMTVTVGAVCTSMVTGRFPLGGPLMAMPEVAAGHVDEGVISFRYWGGAWGGETSSGPKTWPTPLGSAPDAGEGMHEQSDPGSSLRPQTVQNWLGVSMTLNN